jgi:uncharacterized protein (DUF433 family)
MDLPDFLVQDTDGFLRLRGHRIGVQHVVHFYNEGYSAEMLAEEYPTLSLALLHKTIAFYLENQADVDAYVARCRDEIDQQAAAAPRGPGLAELRRRLAARRALAS